MPTLTLTYFDAPGRAEPVRVAMRLLGLAFEDRRLSFAEFMAHKAEGRFPLGSLPVLEVDGVVLAQTASMLRYVARLGGGLYPSDAMSAFVVDSALDTFNDTLSNALVPSMYERDTEKKLAMRAIFAQGPLPLACGYVESLIGRFGGPFLVGEALTVADLVLAAQVNQIRAGGLDGLSAAHLADYPKLCALADATAAHPQIVALAR